MIGSPKKKENYPRNAFERKRKRNYPLPFLRITRPRYAGVGIYGMVRSRYI